MAARGKRTDGPVSRLINRRVSGRISGYIVSRNIPLTPNQASLISAAVGFLALPLYLAGQPALAGVAVQASSILDGVDGEIARARGQTSRLGGFLDSMLDRAVDIAVILGLSIYAYTAGLPPALVLAASMLALAGDLMVSYLHARGEASLGIHPLLLGRVPSLASRDVRLFIVFLGSLASQADPRASLATLVLVAVLSLAYVALKTVDVALSYREGVSSGQGG